MTEDKATVSKRALVLRLKRKLKKSGIELKHDYKKRGWFLVEDGNVTERNVSLRDLAAKEEVLAEHEEYDDSASG